MESTTGKPQRFFDYFDGVPQGSPTSPLLSLLALTDTVMKWVKVVRMYADDGMMAAMTLFSPPKADEFAAEGITFHPDKSGWVKYDGKWLKPLKFLGLIYDGNTDILKASTRKGSKIEVPDFVKAYMVAKDHPMLPRLLSAINGKKKGSDDPEFFLEGFQKAFGKLGSSVTWESMAKSTVMGFVMSRLYQGAFDLNM